MSQLLSVRLGEGGDLAICARCRKLLGVQGQGAIQHAGAEVSKGVVHSGFVIDKGTGLRHQNPAGRLVHLGIDHVAERIDVDRPGARVEHLDQTLGVGSGSRYWPRV